jgi:pimeloyl-ACP methyl ester carboxylesterase
MVATRVRHHRSMTVESSSGSAVPPIWKETLWPVDWLALRMSPVYYGAGVPRGDGSPVVLVPGFMGVDAYLSELYLWLRRVGYRPYMSRIGLNAECPGRLTRKLIGTIEHARRETGRRVRIVGHSLGGVLGRKACLQRPDSVSQLIYLGSPVQAVHAHPAVIGAAVVMQAARELLSGHREDCLTQECGCGFAQDLLRPLPRHVQHAAIYTRADGVVDWHDSQERDPRRNHEVGGTHVGLVFNPRAYRALGTLLSHPQRN